MFVSRYEKPHPFGSNDLFNSAGVRAHRANLILRANQVASQFYRAGVPAVSGYQTQSVL